MTELVFTGKTKWCKPYPGQESVKFKKWTLNFYPTAEDRKTISGLKLRGGVKEDEDGLYYIFGRRADDQRNPGGIIVVDAAGNPFTKLIGNGSTVEVTLQVYGWDNEFGKGTGVRIVRIRVIDWVEYKRPEQDESATAWKETKEDLPV